MLKYLTIFLPMITVSVFASTKPFKLILDQSYLVSDNANCCITVKYHDNQKTKYLSGYVIQGYTEIFPDLDSIINSRKHRMNYTISDIKKHSYGQLGFLITEHGENYNHILKLNNGKLEAKKLKFGDLKCTSRRSNTVTCSVD